MNDKQMIEKLEAEESMFAQTVRGISSDGTTLTLNVVTASTLCFSDRPKRVVGHMSTADSSTCGAQEKTASRKIRPTRCSRSWSPTIKRLKMLSW